MTVSGIVVSGIVVSGIVVSGIVVSGIVVSGIVVSGIVVSGIVVSGIVAHHSAMKDGERLPIRRYISRIAAGWSACADSRHGPWHTRQPDQRWSGRYLQPSRSGHASRFRDLQ